MLDFIRSAELVSASDFFRGVRMNRITLSSNRNAKWVSLGNVLRLAGVCLGLLFCLPAHSQTLGRISGIVTDSSAGAVAGATVTVTDVGRGTARIVMTDSTGSYSAPDLIQGTYRV